MKREQEEMKKIYEKTILQSQIEIQEQTFRHISQEIHDNVGQILSLVSLNVSSMPTTDIEKRTFTRELVAKAVADLRDISKSLNPERIQVLELVHTIKHELDLLEKSGNYHIELLVNNPIEGLSAERKIILFRMIQEVMNNIIKHAKASSIKIVLDQNEESDLISIIDDGIGFSQEWPMNQGIGLSNIKKRGEMIKTSVTIESILNRGTTVNFSIKKENRVA